MTSETAPAAEASAAHRLLFRIGAVYFLLYVLPFPLTILLPQADGWATTAWDPLVKWTGRSLFALPVDVLPRGSGDTSWNYVQLLLMAVLAVTLGALWTALDRSHRRDRWLRPWLAIACRYYLAVTLFGYGFAKVFKTQFPFPHLERLTQPFGDASPMGLVWTFMGYSTAYNLFTGGAEVLAGLLLLFRRTTTLGALLAVGVMSNITMLNFAYDVPVKLFSSHLLAFAGCLALADARRLLDLFVLNRSTEPRDITPPFTHRGTIIATRILKAMLILFVVTQQIAGGLRAQKRWGDQRPKPPLFGVWEVAHFVKDGEVRPPLTTDQERWRYLIIDREGWVSVRYMDGRISRFAFELSTADKTATFATFGDRDTKWEWTWEQPTEGELHLRGELEDSALEVHTTRRDRNDFLLVRRGFHWVNEYPYNR